MRGLIVFLSFVVCSHAFAMDHEMQHGFIISDDDGFAEHLVADGHHSHQVSVTVELDIPSGTERDYYQQQKQLNIKERKYYVLFLAQKLDLPSIKAGQVLEGPIAFSKIGDFEPKNIYVKQARLIVKKVHINVENPFFKNPGCE